jgi:DNA-binding LytR/AlgR family response regulator
MEALVKLPQLSFVTVNHKQKLYIQTDRIVMLEGHNNYTLFHLENGKKKLFARSISHFEKQLEENQFIRCHRAYLVNPAYIKGYDKSQCVLYLENDLTASISRRKHGNLEGVVC